MEPTPYHLQRIVSLEMKTQLRSRCTYWDWNSVLKGAYWFVLLKYFLGTISMMNILQQHCPVYAMKQNSKEKHQINFANRLIGEIIRWRKISKKVISLTQSRISTFLAPAAWAANAATAALLWRQNPIACFTPAWWPGGRTWFIHSRSVDLMIQISN